MRFLSTSTPSSFFTSFSQTARRAVAIVALAVPLAALAGTIHSGLRIEAGKQFVLGGDQRGAFLVKGKNTGPVAVRVIERFATGDTLGRGTVAPGAKATVQFQEGSAALIVNPSTREARLDLVVTGSTQSLGMGYEVLGAK